MMSRGGPLQCRGIFCALLGCCRLTRSRRGSALRPGQAPCLYEQAVLALPFPGHPLALQLLLEQLVLLLEKNPKLLKMKMVLLLE